MTQIIKIYDDAKKAQAAVAALKAASFDNAELKDGTTVLVNPPFGQGAQADAILKGFGPVRDASGGYGRASTSTLGSELTSSRTTLGGIFPELTSPNFFLSAIVGPLLTASQKPFSSLAKSQKPFSQLAANQNSSTKLINDPAPFSHMLGLPVLITR